MYAVAYNWMDSFAFTVKFHFPLFKGKGFAEMQLCKLFLPLQACDYPHVCFIFTFISVRNAD